MPASRDASDAARTAGSDRADVPAAPAGTASPSGSPTSIPELLRRGGRSISFEFSPPKDAEAEEVLWRSISELEPLHPTFVSVTYGAGGGNRDRVIEITGRIARETSMLPMAHLTCVGHTTQEVAAVLRRLEEAGVRNVLALRGDPREGPRAPWVSTPGGLDYASDLVRFVRDEVGVSVGVAAFPEGHVGAATLDDDADVLRAKRDAGAEFAVTEMVLRAADYRGLVERAAQVGLSREEFPIIPGIMPILNLRSMARMVELSGRDMPPEVLARLEPLADDPAAVRAEGIRLAVELCEELLADGAPGLHFYTLNRSKATREIHAALSLSA